MTSLVLVTALLIQTQRPEHSELRDPFVEVAQTADQGARRARTPVGLPNDLVDPFTRRAPARPLAGPPHSELVDPFARRPGRTERVPSQLTDPFSSAPDLADPFAPTTGKAPTADLALCHAPPG